MQCLQCLFFQRSKSKTLHPRNLTWNPKLEVWKMFFLFTTVILRFHVSFPGGTGHRTQLARVHVGAVLHPSTVLGLQLAGQIWMHRNSNVGSYSIKVIYHAFSFQHVLSKKCWNTLAEQKAQHVVPSAVSSKCESFKMLHFDCKKWSCSYIENYPRDVLAPVFFHSTIPQKKLMIRIHKRFPTKGTNFTKSSTLRFGDILQGGPLAVTSGGITPINIRL